MERKRKLAGLKADGQNKVAGYDMKHMCLPGTNPALTAPLIRSQNKPCCARYYAVRSEQQDGPGEVVRRYGPNIVIINDNGSENKGKAGEFPAEKEIIQYRAPRRPQGEAPY